MVMPKRKSNKKKRSAVPVRAVLEEESDDSDMGMEDDSGSLLEEGRADFLKELTLYVISTCECHDIVIGVLILITRKFLKALL